jgi:hypothetical protein
MASFERRAFEGLHDRSSGATYSGLTFVECQFDRCTLSTAKKPSERTVVRTIRARSCRVMSCSIYAAVLQDIVIDGLDTRGQLLQTWGAVFDRVVLRGRVGRLMFSNEASPSLGEGTREAFRNANASFYGDVEWALDIREAEVKELDIRGIPARLIRRDPETQVVIERETALHGAWRRIDLEATDWRTAIELFLERGEPDLVLVAAKLDRRYSQMVKALKRLRDAGVAA